MADHITHDPIYNTVDRDNFRAMIEVPRYAERTDAFDAIIAATADHFWDPEDPAYVDFDQEFDLDERMLLPREMIPELNCAVADKLDAHQQVKLANENAHFILSSILHGEQGAFSLSASLCHILRDPGSQEYAANQAREEGRHVNAFSKYIGKRWGAPLQAGATLANLMNDLVLAAEVYKKLIGMQMLIEGLAMGAFATIHAHTADPVLRRLVQLVMTDEAFHHRFGKIWARRTVPKLTAAEHDKVEQWAAEVFNHLLFNLINPQQKQEIYRSFGLDWQWVQSAVTEAFGDAERRRMMTESTNIFRVLIKTLLKAGIITDRTQATYSVWVDMGELVGENDDVAGTDVAEEGIRDLRSINRSRKRIGRPLRDRTSGRGT